MPLILGGSSATSPLKIWDVMPEDTLRAKKKKQKIDNVDHICFDDPQEHLFPSPQKNPLSIKGFPVFGVRNAGLWT